MKRLKLYEEFGKEIDETTESNIDFVKKSKKEGAKTDTYDVIKNGDLIGQIRWSSRMRGYAFLPEKDDEQKIKDFVKKLMLDRRKK